MRAWKFALAVFVMAGATACNSGQPRIFRIAVDGSPLASLPPSCYLNNTVSTRRVIATNIRDERQFVVWDGFDNKQYLDMGSYTVRLGDAEPVNVGSMIEGTDRVFSGQLVEQQLPQPNSNYTFTKTFSLVITFDDMGAAPRGSIDASSQYTCTNCTNNDNKVAQCAAKLTFTGRRVDTSTLSAYSPSGGSI